MPPAKAFRYAASSTQDRIPPFLPHKCLVRDRNQQPASDPVFRSTNAIEHANPILGAVFRQGSPHSCDANVYGRAHHQRQAARTHSLVQARNYVREPPNVAISQLIHTAVSIIDEKIGARLPLRTIKRGPDARNQIAHQRTAVCTDNHASQVLGRIDIVLHRSTPGDGIRWTSRRSANRSQRRVLAFAAMTISALTRTPSILSAKRRRSCERKHGVCEA